MFLNSEEQGSFLRRKNKRNKWQIKVISHTTVWKCINLSFLFLEPDDNHLLLGYLGTVRL